MTRMSRWSTASRSAPLGSGRGGRNPTPSVEIIADKILLHGSSAATATFTRQGDGSFTAPARVKATLASGQNGGYVLTYRDQTKHMFDSSGVLLRLRDRNGYATTLSYTAGGRLDRVTDAAGRSLSYDYDAVGRIATITDPAGRHVAYAYDAYGDLVRSTDVAGHDTRY